jgi:hypothetical protein
VLHRAPVTLSRALVVLLALGAACGDSGAAIVDAARTDSAVVPGDSPKAVDAALVDAVIADTRPPIDARPPPPPCEAPPGTAPTYTELYTRYLAPGTAGHCATDNCHGGDNYNVWSCGPDSTGCYAGMLAIALIDRERPSASRLASPQSSPIVWVNPSGQMPANGTQAFPPGSSAAIARDEIIAWANACAPNN